MGVFGFLSDASKTVGGAVGSIGIGDVTIGNGVKAVSNAVGLATNFVNNIPILGPVLGVTTGIHLVDFANDVLRGQSIDVAAKDTLKKKVKDYVDLAPYVSSVVAFVPAIGPGLGAAMAAGAEIAQGHPWTDVAIAAARGAIPGGAIAQMAFNAASAAVRGEPIENVGISALPLSQQQRDGLITGLNIAKQIAAGQPIDKALLANVDGIIRTISPEIVRALQIGTAIGLAANIQDQIKKDLSNPLAKKLIEDIGFEIAKTNRELMAGLNASSSPAYKAGYNVAIGMLAGKHTPTIILNQVREGMNTDAKTGFDAAVAFIIGHKMGSTALVSLKRAKGGSVAALVPVKDPLRAIGKAKGATPMTREKFDAGNKARAKAKMAPLPLPYELMTPAEKAAFDAEALRIAKEAQSSPIAQMGLAARKKFQASVDAKKAATEVGATTPAQDFAYYATIGLQGSDVEAKQNVVATLVQTPEGREGAGEAIKTVANAREEPSLWERFLSFFGF